MHVVADTLDDLLREVYPRLLSSENQNKASRGSTREVMGALLELRKPRARLSRTETRGKPFSCLGELLWYLSRDNKLDFISHYIKEYEKESEDGETVLGGYGPRLFGQRGHDQVRNVVDQLRARRSSRRAVIQILNAEDVARRPKEIPCTCTLQFMIRNDRLHMISTLRSNDAYLGLPHDVFCFTMLQEIVARDLGVELGIYQQFVGSLHLYDRDIEGANQFMGEDLQSTVEMPEMPKGNPWPSIQRVLSAEHNIRNNLPLGEDAMTIDPYWCDLIRLLQIFFSTGDADRINEIKAQMSFPRYGPYIEQRKSMQRLSERKKQQLVLI